ncbi:MAG: flagellar FlbD family protein [Alicyclobacillus herbarius]|uniref:flagellar FlbD family protein n=1 Tax=Alicyclobacillus herbarius TaxID=122960 RepID=UPI00041F5B9C|nr:flagellar FlbD family protein [Alicyclobacillus herbarius]MCL6631984.1 flagellar FlbD family protein [Alicyclobacillus herbarius]
MIQLTRINGSAVWLNPLLVESIEQTPDSVVTLSNSHKYVVRESPEQIRSAIVEFWSATGWMGGTPRGDGVS